VTTGNGSWDEEKPKLGFSKQSRKVKTQTDGDAAKRGGMVKHVSQPQKNPEAEEKCDPNQGSRCWYKVQGTKKVFWLRYKGGKRGPKEQGGQRGKEAEQREKVSLKPLKRKGDTQILIRGWNESGKGHEKQKIKRVQTFQTRQKIKLGEAKGGDRDRDNYRFGNEKEGVKQPVKGSPVTRKTKNGEMKKRGGDIFKPVGRNAEKRNESTSSRKGGGKEV